MTERLSTGVSELDRQFRADSTGDQGLPAGSMVAVEATPGDQVEPLVWAFMTERPTVYVSTLRSGDAVRDELETVADGADYDVRDVGLDTPVRDTSEVVELVDGPVNLVVDPVTPLEETDGDRFVAFLNGLKRHLTNTGGLALLLAPTAGDGRSRTRGRTLGVADLVWELRTEADASRVETYLVVRKFRGGEVPDEPISLDLGRQVRVDTSRDIA